MKYLSYVALAIFTFAVGVGISPIRFYPEMIACGPRNSSTSYRSSYFMQTSRSYITYDTEAEARVVFDEEVDHALKVYEVSGKVNDKGLFEQQRAVYQIYHPGNDEYYVEIMRRDGRTVTWIHSRSYTHVMEFEKQYF